MKDQTGPDPAESGDAVRTPLENLKAAVKARPLLLVVSLSIVVLSIGFLAFYSTSQSHIILRIEVVGPEGLLDGANVSVQFGREVIAQALTQGGVASFQLPAAESGQYRIHVVKPGFKEALKTFTGNPRLRIELIPDARPNPSVSPIPLPTISPSPSKTPFIPPAPSTLPTPIGNGSWGGGSTMPTATPTATPEPTATPSPSPHVTPEPSVTPTPTPHPVKVATFDEPRVYNLDADTLASRHDLALMDVDGNGRDDVVLRALDGNPSMSVALSQADWSVAEPKPWQYAGSFQGYVAAVGDFTNDGFKDALLHYNDHNSWRGFVAQGYGNASFGKPVSWVLGGNFSGWQQLQGDVDGDGKSDLVLIDVSSGILSTRTKLGSPGNTFRDGPSWQGPARTNRWQAHLGDANGDGRADLVLYEMNNSAWSIRVAYSKPDASMGELRYWQADGDFSGLMPLFGDFNGDGREDVFAYSKDGRNVYVRGAFASEDGYASLYAWESALQGVDWTIQIGEFNADNRTDLLMHKWRENTLQIRVATTKTDGTLGGFYVWSLTESQLDASWNVYVADLNGDHHSDIVLAKRSGTRWDAKLAYAESEIGAFTRVVNWTESESFQGSKFGVADFNSDDNADLLVQDNDVDGWRIQVAFALPWQTLIHSRATTLPSASQTDAGVVWKSFFGDVNGDGRVDVVRQSNDVNGMRANVWFGQADGVFTSHSSWTIPGRFQGWMPKLEDVDGDGRDDWYLDSFYQGRWNIKAVLAREGSVFSQGVLSWSSTGNAYTDYSNWTVAPADFNGDGKVDAGAHFMNHSTFQIHTALADPKVLFGETVAWHMDGRFDGFQASLVDVNGDGMADVVLWDLNGIIYVALSNGAGGFTPQLPIAEPIPGSASDGRRWFIDFADFNGDGKSDYVAHSTNPDVRLTIRLGAGQNPFTEFVQVRREGIHLVDALSIGDVNGDGRDDVVLHRVSDGALNIHLLESIFDAKPSNGLGVLMHVGAPEAYVADECPRFRSQAGVDGFIVQNTFLVATRPPREDHLPILTDMQRRCAAAGVSKNFLRTSMGHGTPDWFDDAAWSTYLSNFRRAAKMARDAGFVGFAIDTEPYPPTPCLWTSSPSPALFYSHCKGDNTRTSEQYRQKVFERGQELAKSILDEYPQAELLFMLQGRFIFSDSLRSQTHIYWSDFIGGVLSMQPAGGIGILSEAVYRDFDLNCWVQVGAYSCNPQRGFFDLKADPASLTKIAVEDSLPHRPERNFTRAALARLWRKNGFVVLGSWPFGAETSPDKQPYISLPEFQKQMDSFKKYSQKYAWFYGTCAAFTKLDAEKFPVAVMKDFGLICGLNPGWGAGSQYAPTADNFEAYLSVMKTLKTDGRQA